MRRARTRYIGTSEEASLSVVQGEGAELLKIPYKFAGIRFLRSISMIYSETHFGGNDAISPEDKTKTVSKAFVGHMAQEMSNLSLDCAKMATEAQTVTMKYALSELCAQINRIQNALSNASRDETTI
jgi:hypothetical protein